MFQRCGSVQDVRTLMQEIDRCFVPGLKYSPYFRQLLKESARIAIGKMPESKMEKLAEMQPHHVEYVDDEGDYIGTEDVRLFIMDRMVEKKRPQPIVVAPIQYTSNKYYHTGIYEQGKSIIMGTPAMHA